MIYGIQKTSFVDCPGVDFGMIHIPPSLCSVLFLGGCNLRCPYCHNKDIVLKTIEPIDDNFVFELLEKRKHLINWICISGGEPTENDGLYDLLKILKHSGYYIKLDTNGLNKEAISSIKDFVDYFAIDIKALDYKPLGDKNGFNKLVGSIEYLIEIEKPFLLRTTVYPPYVDEVFIKSVLEYLNFILKAKNKAHIKINWYLNPFDNMHTLNKEASKCQSTDKAYIKELLKDIVNPNFQFNI